MLSVRSAVVSFGSLRALDGLKLRVGDGEAVAVLGPSGCGKSTLLRAIAGLQPISGGSIRWDGEDLSGVPVHKRGFGLMFQDHALFTHRDVAANVSFGLRMQRMRPADAERRVVELLRLVGLPGYEPRAISTLSGGEAQRVALARALAPRPCLLMLDEPLGSLDRCLRDELAHEIRALQRRLGVTVLHVTHDHAEAFAVADRVAVMASGRITRVGAPEEVWRDPRREDVARFLGHSNIVTVEAGGAVPWGRLTAEPGRVVLRSDAFRRVSAPAAAAADRAPPPGGSIEAGTPGKVRGVVADARFLGDRFELRLRTDPGGAELTVRDDDPAVPGEPLCYLIDPDAVAHLE